MKAKGKQETVMAWHWTAQDKYGKAVLRDGKPVPRNGRWLTHDGECVMCDSGLHASRNIIDALNYAPGVMLCRVECADVVAEQTDKLVCRRRMVIARADMLWALVTFAEWCAVRASASAARAAARAAAWAAAWAAASAAASAASASASTASAAASAAEIKWQSETLELLFDAMTSKENKRGRRL